jgi:hypothetical protein
MTESGGCIRMCERPQGMDARERRLHTDVRTSGGQHARERRLHTDVRTIGEQRAQERRCTPMHDAA